MKKGIEVLNAGLPDKLDILSAEEMDFILGGYSKCGKNYEVFDDGKISCGCGYQYIPIVNPGQPGDPKPITNG